MKKLLLVLALALPVFANPVLFTRYETLRQSLLKQSLADVQKSAAQLASDAHKANQPAVARQAQAVARSTDLDKARASFGALSDAMIQVRSKASGARPAVYFCSMAKKSWLQPKGTVGNPYEPAMPTCGELKAD